MKRVEDMTESEKTQIRAWIRNWEEAAPVLEQERIASIRRADTAAAIEALDSAFKSAKAALPHRATSGLVEQQRWLHRGRL